MKYDQDSENISVRLKKSKEHLPHPCPYCLCNCRQSLSAKISVFRTQERDLVAKDFPRDNYIKAFRWQYFLKQKLALKEVIKKKVRVQFKCESYDTFHLYQDVVSTRGFWIVLCRNNFILASHCCMSNVGFDGK